jgi:hypothetical protein
MLIVMMVILDTMKRQYLLSQEFTAPVDNWNVARADAYYTATVGTKCKIQSASSFERSRALIIFCRLGFTIQLL